MTRRTTVALVWTLALGTPIVLCGCANDHGGSRSVDNGTEYTVVVRNDSKHAVDVAWAIMHLRQDDGGLSTPVERSLGVVAPHVTARDGPSTFGMEAAHAGEYTQVFRIRLTIPSASWQESARMWWEVVGPLPQVFVIENGPGPDGFLVKLRADGAAIEAVPRQFWTDPDPQDAGNR